MRDRRAFLEKITLPLTIIFHSCENISSSSKYNQVLDSGIAMKCDYLYLQMHF